MKGDTRHEALAHSIESQLRFAGTVDPVIRLGPEEFTTYDEVKDDAGFREWLRRTTAKWGLPMTPRIVRV